MPLTIRAAAVTPVVQAVDARGGDPIRVLVAAGLRADQLQDPDALVDLEGALRFTRAAAEELGEESLGLHLGEQWDLASLGVLSYAVLNAPTVETALRNLDRYGRSHVQGGSIRFECQGARARLSYELDVADRELARQHAEAAAVVGVRILRRLLDPSWRPQSVHFAHRRPADLSDHERIFGCPIGFDAPLNALICFDAEVLDRRVAGADRQLLPLVERHLESLHGPPGADPWFGRVREAVSQALCDGSPTIQTIARQLGMSVRTLQRRLETHDLVYKELVERIRRELAHRYLAESEASLTEVAFLLGYSELSAFDRAFRRWTGRTPLAARRSLRSAG
jgi:AraC-like DNA-binding protein